MHIPHNKTSEHLCLSQRWRYPHYHWKHHSLLDGHAQCMSGWNQLVPLLENAILNEHSHSRSSHFNGMKWGESKPTIGWWSSSITSSYDDFILGDGRQWCEIINAWIISRGQIVHSLINTLSQGRTESGAKIKWSFQKERMMRLAHRRW